MHQTKRLTIYLSAGIIALVAWVLNVSQLYWMAGVMLLLPYVSRQVALLEQRGLEVERQVPAAAHQGEAVQVRFLVRNLLALPKLQLSLADVLPEGLTAVTPEPVPVHLPPRGCDRAHYTLQLRRRGLHTIPAVR